MRITGAVLTTTGSPRPFADSRPIVISDLELAPPRAGEVLIRMEAAGVCHSDLSVVDGNRERPVPMLLGHEASGVVISTGSDVHDLDPGQRVVMTFLPRCGSCAGCRTDGRLPCTEGSAANEAGALLEGGRRLSDRAGSPVFHHLGVSGFATHAVVDRRSLVPVADDVPPEVAAVLGCAVLTGGGAVINAGKPEDGQTTAVVGLGGVGMAALMTAVALGKGPVIGVDPVETKLRLASELGADHVYTPAEALAAGVTAEVVIEAAGNSAGFECAFDLTAAGGTTVTVGLPPPDARANVKLLALTAQARSVKGSYLGSAVPERDIPAFVAMWREGALPVERLISTTISLGDLNEAMDDLAAGTALRQIVLFDGMNAAHYQPEEHR